MTTDGPKKRFCVCDLKKRAIDRVKEMLRGINRKALTPETRDELRGKIEEILDEEGL